MIHKEITRTQQSAIYKASWSSWHRQFTDTTVALPFGFCIQNVIWSCWFEI